MDRVGAFCVGVRAGMATGAAIAAVPGSLLAADCVAGVALRGAPALLACSGEAAENSVINAAGSARCWHSADAAARECSGEIIWQSDAHELCDVATCQPVIPTRPTSMLSHQLLRLDDGRKGQVK